MSGGGASPAGHGTHPAAAVEAAFRAVAGQGMAGLPFVNPALRVAAVDFDLWQEQWLGVLVTPWAMNLLLLPALPEAWPVVDPGRSRSVTFPAGVFEFVAGRHSALGEYHACSLFSPMFEFADHATACLTARAAKLALFRPSAGDGPPQPVAAATPGISRRDFLRRACP